MATCKFHSTGVQDAAERERVEVNVPGVGLIGELLQALEVNGNGSGGGGVPLREGDGTTDAPLVEG